MWGAGLILNTGEAYESAKQSGLDEEDAAMLSHSVGFINTLLEQKFGANLVNRWIIFQHLKIHSQFYMQYQMIYRLSIILM